MLEPGFSDAVFAVCVALQRGNVVVCVTTDGLVSCGPKRVLDWRNRATPQEHLYVEPGDSAILFVAMVGVENATRSASSASAAPPIVRRRRR